MEDDEVNLSNANNPYQLEPKEETLANEEISVVEQCESFHPSIESNLTEFGDKSEAVVPENENSTAGEGGAEEDFELTATEFCEVAGELSGHAVAANDTAPFDSLGSELVSTDDYELTPMVEDDLKVVTGGDKIVTDTVDEVPEMGEGEAIEKVEPNDENLGAEEIKIADQHEQFHQLTESNLNVSEDKSEVVVSEDEKLIAGEIETVDTQTIENDAEIAAVETAEGSGEKISVLIENSDVVATEELASIEEGKVDTVSSEDFFSNEAKMGVETVIEGDLDATENSVPENFCKLSGRDIKDEPVEEKGVAFAESSMPETEISVEKNIVLEVLKDPELDEPANVAGNNEEVVMEEASLSGNLKNEIELEIETSKIDVAEETQLEEAEVKADTITEVVGDETPLVGMEMGIEETKIDVDEPGEDMDDSVAVSQDEEDETIAMEEETGDQDTELETETEVVESGKSLGGKRKRGKISKCTSVSKSTAKGSSRKKTVGEDVCFICFDGGDLVLCDRRGCPKAYHPSCVNRDEAFFQSKGLWNCGWHMCSICEKNAHFMCYTCTFSLCKSCTKGAVIFRVRGNKGFCETCMRTVKLIENNEEGENKQDQIDFEDRSSWEFLFKDYYIDLKSKLSLSSAEILESKNPWKGTKQESSEPQDDANNGGSGSDDSIENEDTTILKRKKTKKRPKRLTKEKQSGRGAISSSDDTEWVSKELLEFISHMKNGDTSVLSQFDVQALLLEYIKENKLRDPRRKSQIICDSRLENLFGKPRVGHFEMLKLLESHFLVKDDPTDDVEGSVVDTENSQLEGDGNAETTPKGGSKEKKRKARKKGGSRGPQSNLDDYAAVDMHNIGLIYLRRKLMEDLLEDVESFHDKVVGTFVRIRISGSNQKQELYRLVQVVGTSKAADPYRIGKKITDTMVEILNLDKTEVIQIDTISNQDFTEEECNRLRQSIKCGLISRLTVGEILDKAMEIQVARVNDWLESETLRLSHLRDRASDLGRRKDLRECVEKLQLLKTPEERRRRLEEIPVIHADPKMDPSYESEENNSETEENRRDAFMRSRASGFSRRGTGPISPRFNNSGKDSWSGSGKVPTKNWELDRNLSSNSFSPRPIHNDEMMHDILSPQEKNKAILEPIAIKNLSSPSNNQSRPESFTSVQSVASQAPMVSETPVKINESEKIWHYQDPAGKVQGPFSMTQLRKWNKTGYFPTGLKIWKNTENQDDSIPLVDALEGKFPKKLPSVDQNPGSHSKLNPEKWAGNDTTNFPSPTPKQSNATWNGGENGLFTNAVQTQSPAVNVSAPSPAEVLPNTAIHSSAPVVQSSAVFNPMPNSIEQHGVQMHGQQPVMSHNQLGQAQGYGWGAPAPNVQNSSANLSNPSAPAPIMPQPDIWGPPAGQPTQNVPYGVGPEYPNPGWTQVQANSTMGAGNPATVNANINWVPAMQVPPPAFPTVPGPVSGNVNPGWVAWGPPPVPSPVPGNGWGPPSGNPGVQVQGPGVQVQAPGVQVQGPGGPVQGNSNQGWGPTPGFGNGGQQPFNRRFGGGSRQFNKRDTICPYNANGRCRKGAHCDYRHN